jgi:hypothetical protein
VKRFFKTLSLVVLSLLLLVSGVDVTIGHLSRTPDQASFTWYDAGGRPLLQYRGDLAHCKIYSNPVRVARTFTPRVNGDSFD